MIIPIGVTTKKKIILIITGEINLPISNPKFIHNLLNGVRILEFNRPNIKKINEITNDHNLIFSLFNNG